MERNGECAELQLTCLTGAAQPRLNYQCTSSTATSHCRGLKSRSSIAHMLLYASMILLLAHHQVRYHCSFARPDSHTKNKSLAL